MSANRPGIGMTSRRTRERLVLRLREQGVADERVLGAMLDLPRHLFVDEALASRAYEDTALPIGHNQTISRPYSVARMTEVLLNGRNPARVLEVGTGCGYQTAVLAALVGELFSIERIAPLSLAARRRLTTLGVKNARLKIGDGSEGWPEHAPFDAILVTAAASSVPPQLVQQLANGGRMIVPVGSTDQELLLIERQEDGMSTQRLEAARFVPLVKGG